MVESAIGAARGAGKNCPVRPPIGSWSQADGTRTPWTDLNQRRKCSTWGRCSDLTPKRLALIRVERLRAHRSAAMSARMWPSMLDQGTAGRDLAIRLENEPRISPETPSSA